MSKQNPKEKIDPARVIRVAALVVADVIALNLSWFLALLLRFNLEWKPLMDSGFVETCLRLTLPNTILSIVIFAALTLYRSLWNYASVDELLRLFLAAVGSSFLYVAEMVFAPEQTDHLAFLPRSMPILYGMILCFLLIAIHFSYRMVRRIRHGGTRNGVRTMLIGAGDAGVGALREFRYSSHSKNNVVCLIDDDPAKRGQRLMGVKIVGGRESIPEAAEKYKVDEIILAMPSAARSQRREILEICQQTRCKLKQLPGIYQLTNGEVSIQKIQNVRIEDLLGRDVVNVTPADIAGYVNDKTVLVTGGGGSIGSELCRQLASFGPRHLVIFDIYENNAYEIQQELRKRYPELSLHVLIGSVRDKKRLDAVMETYKPEIVYHAAAHKHVPLMEDAPLEAIKNNVFGTYNTALSAAEHGVRRFLLISTDKAVNPTNVMGASKRMCEMVIQTMDEQFPDTSFAAVRFGNVLGSNGSVIPLFRKQIEAGGPVTVTHKDITRFFMTIPEAVSLVLQAGAYAKGGEIFVLDMGKPMRIDDLARKMIRLSGFEPDVDIPVVYTGLRPGEKLYEELLMSEEGLSKTDNDLIYVGHKTDFDRQAFREGLDTLRAFREEDVPTLRDTMKKIVPTFRPKD